MDLEEFGFPSDPLGDMEVETAQPVLHPLDWNEVLDDLIPPTDSRMGILTTAAGPGHDYLPPAVGLPHPVLPMLIATQSVSTHPVHYSSRYTVAAAVAVPRAATIAGVLTYESFRCTRYRYSGGCSGFAIVFATVVPL